MIVDFDAGDLSVAKVDHPVRHRGDAGVVGNDNCGCAQIAVGPRQRLKHAHPGSAVERPGRLVAEQTNTNVDGQEGGAVRGTAK